MTRNTAHGTDNSRRLLSFISITLAWKEILALCPLFFFSFFLLPLSSKNNRARVSNNRSRSWTKRKKEKNTFALYVPFLSLLCIPYIHTHTYIYIYRPRSNSKSTGRKRNDFRFFPLKNCNQPGAVLFRVNFRHVESRRPGSNDDTRNFPRYAMKLFNSVLEREHWLIRSFCSFERQAFSRVLFNCTSRRFYSLIVTYVRHVRMYRGGQIVRCVWSQFEFLFRDAKEKERNQKKKKGKKKKTRNKREKKDLGEKKKKKKKRKKILVEIATLNEEEKKKVKSWEIGEYKHRVELRFASQKLVRTKSEATS